MRAFRVKSFDSQPALAEIEEPHPKEDEVGLDIYACGLNFADLLMQNGKYQDTPPVPFTQGMEVAGIVTNLPQSARGLKVGDRVAVFGGSGGLAESGVFPTDRIVKIPDAMSMEAAAALQIAYGTSHLALDYKARLKPGENLVVLGAAGGVGLTAVEIGKLMGAQVIAVARGSEKLEIAKKAGADHLIDASEENLRDKIRALGGADVVYDPVGGDQFTAAFRACNPEARILIIGFASGTVPEIKANHAMVKNIDLLGFYWGGYLKFRPEIVTDSLKTLFQWAEQGQITPHISHILPLEDAAEALNLLRDRRSTGKVIVSIKKE